MSVSRGSTRALVALARAVGPHVEGNALERTLLDAALSELGANDVTRQAAEDALAQAGIRVAGTSNSRGPAPSTYSYTEPEPALSDEDRSTTASDSSHRVGTSREEPPSREAADPLAAARRRIEADGAIRRPEKVILSAEEEVGLTLLARPDGRPLPKGGLAKLHGEQRTAAEALVLHNLGLAHHVAKTYVGQGLEYEDLYSSGLPGLIRAVERFDPAAGFKFSTFAVHWLRQSVTRALANEGRAVRLPVHKWELVRKVVVTRENLTVDGRPPDLTVLAEKCGITVPKLVECLRLAPAVLSLDAPYGRDQFTLADLVDATVSCRDDSEVWGVSAEEIISLIDHIETRESDVLRMRYGLPPYEKAHRLNEIARKYKLTPERIRQIEIKAKHNLRVLMFAEGLTLRVPGPPQTVPGGGGSGPFLRTGTAA